MKLDCVSLLLLTLFFIEIKARNADEFANDGREYLSRNENGNCDNNNIPKNLFANCTLKSTSPNTVVTCVCLPACLTWKLECIKGNWSYTPCPGGSYCERDFVSYHLYVTFYRPCSTYTFECYPGYNIEGETERECKNGLMIPSGFPACRNTVDAGITRNGLTPRYQATTDRSWSSWMGWSLFARMEQNNDSFTPPEEQQKSPLKKCFEDKKILVSQIKNNSTFSFNCYEGYELTGQSEVSCQSIHNIKLEQSEWPTCERKVAKEDTVTLPECSECIENQGDTYQSGLELAMSILVGVLILVVMILSLVLIVVMRKLRQLRSNASIPPPVSPNYEDIELDMQKYQQDTTNKRNQKDDEDYVTVENDFYYFRHD